MTRAERAALDACGVAVTVGRAASARSSAAPAPTSARSSASTASRTARGAEALRGQELTVAAATAPALGEGEWWAHELEGCAVFDGERALGTVARMIEMPSCELLEVTRRAGRAAARADGRATRSARSTPTGGASTSTAPSWGWRRADGDRRLHAVPGVVRVARSAAPRRQRARRRIADRVRRLPRAHAALRRAGRRHAVRRRRGHGAARRRDRRARCAPATASTRWSCARAGA